MMQKLRLFLFFVSHEVSEIGERETQTSSYRSHIHA